MDSNRSTNNAGAYTLLCEWFRQPLGVALAAEEQRALEEIFPTLFGYHLLLAAPPWGESTLRHCRVRNQVVLYPAITDCRNACALCGDPEAQPIITDSIDAVILPHTLELAVNPHQVLREADRGLIPEGHLIVIGFNPVGAWGLWKVLAKWRRRMPWALRFVSVTRLTDWLALLGFDVVHTQPLFFQLPLAASCVPGSYGLPAVFKRKHWYPAAGAYILVARKRVTGVTPIRPRWRPRRFMAPGLAEPTRREAADV